MSKFHHFKSDILEIELPQKFTFPFYYEPHPIALLAVDDLQSYLKNQTDFVHNFGLDKKEEGLAVGKMFGVLVVKNTKNQLGYLTAYSGNFSDKSSPDYFVPPVFDVYDKQGFFRVGEEELNAINQELNDLENHSEYIRLSQELQDKQVFVKNDLQAQRDKMVQNKQDRKVRRERAEASINTEDFQSFNKKLRQESLNDQFLYKELIEYRNDQLKTLEKELKVYTERITYLKSSRKSKSNDLQQQLFEGYQFLNQQKEQKALTDIFLTTDEKKIPSGSGDCCAPKLLQYAFANELKPIALAEFWWGISPKMEIRQHQNFYPACQGRCKPILGHMLQGLEMDANPLKENPAETKELPIIFEDDAIIVVNKPAEFLSVPGKDVTDSVYTRIKDLYPKATGPLIVHRLDMSTSGILVLTKTKEANKLLQEQFITRTVKKRYVSLLDGVVEYERGEIDLPLRVDLDDRPRQLVCYEHGKNAKTYWDVIARKDGKTRVHLFPVTGRTHQLRVHVSHPSGLNIPMVGDDLYGKKANRLHLHAEHIEFVHPITKEKKSFTVAAEF